MKRKMLTYTMGMLCFAALVQAIYGQEAANGNFFATVKQGGLLMIPLFILGMVALTIILERCIFLIRSKIYSAANLKSFLEKEAASLNLQYQEEISNRLYTASQNYIARLEKGLTLLNGIGNVAPILGFLGTVVGMIDAFSAIAAATTVNAKVVAVGIQIALVTTAGGLFVAVPALAGYHFFAHILQRLYSENDQIIADLTEKAPALSKVYAR